MKWSDPAPADTASYPPAEVFAAGLRNHHVSNTAYPLAHDRTWRPYRVARPEHEPLVRRAWAGIRALSLYVHVPFCETRCSFCEYTVVGREEKPAAARYVAALLAELERYRELLADQPRRFLGFDIGGGTPTFLPAAEIARIVAAARASFDFAQGDISIETTPKLAAADPDKIAGLYAAGIRRISMGIQVIEPDLLRVLNRGENGVETHFRAVEHIRRAGFARFNVDLMYGFAGQSPASWLATLDHAIRLGPEAITLYRMRYKLTRLSHQAPRVTLDDVRPLALLAKQRLAGAGYHANPGKTTWSRIPGEDGTSAYLSRRVREGLPYLGLGLGAQSFSHATIAYNDGAAGKNLAPYLRSLDEGRLPIQDLYHLPARQAMGKFCAVSFYFGEIDRAAFRARFGAALEQVFPGEIEFLVSRGLMEWGERALSLTPEGAGQVNGAIALFFAPSIQAYLLARDPERAEDLARNRGLALRVAGEPAHA